MRHEIKNDIDAKRVGPFLRELAEEIRVLALALPAVAIVHVVRGDDHDAALLVEYRADMHVSALLVTALMPRVHLPGDTTVPLALFSRRVVGSLQAVLWTFEIEHTMKNRVVHRQFDELLFRQDALDFMSKDLPLPFAPKVVRHEHAAIEQILSQDGNLFIS